jgi:NAD(P)-dependent dehydrogenase (short-subunit alcohol dehydrogenase family)
LVTAKKGEGMTDLLARKIAVVTGGGMGIGRGIALMFAKEGASVAVIDISADAGIVVADEIESRSGRAIPISCDVGNRLDVDAAIRTAVDAFGTVDILVNAAIAGAPRVPLLETTDELVESMWRSGLLGTLHCIQACYPYMRGRDSRIINFGSGAGVSGLMGYSAYAPAKEAVRSLTKVAARELGPEGIRVNAICPSSKTRLMDAWMAEDPERAHAVEAAMPLRRFGDPEIDVPLAAVFLASNYSQYVTGHTLLVDGGSCLF